MKRILKNIILGLFIFTLGFGSVYTIAKADSGWDSDYDSGWDSDYDSGWDSDYGSDWGSSGSYYSGSAGGSLSGGAVFIIFAIIVIVVIINSRNNGNKGGKGSSNISSVNNSYKDIDIDKIKEIDPNLNINEFKQKAYNIYKDIQEAWMNFDTDKIRKLTTDELYNMYKSQLDTLKLKKQKNIMKDFELLDVKVFDISKEKDVITIKVFLNVRCYDYVVKEGVGEVTRGTDKMKMNIKYELSFVKSATNDKKVETCPNCGAPVEIIGSSTCPYCDSTLVKDSSDYVMSKKTSVGQTMER